MLDDLAIRIRQNIGLVTAILLFCALYIFYNAAHPRGFSSAVLVQNGDEILRSPCWRWRRQCRS